MCTFIGENLIYYQIEFDLWLSDPVSNHNHWIHDAEQGDALCFGSDDFVDWLNRNFIKKSMKKVKIVAYCIHPTAEERKLPHINF
ncbi:hypothetical protein [Anaeromicropila populeti]|uniref:Uncharacterized protein n=1 Tax=Anaeromicropila populeti TaxID=37658 RepID=A0A1I6LL60_9FIRM|nr:hypothetical protein [Anaeromicropila populeti]SFS04002.1 hypothetical protein SAMN05661086_03363 [Anaeromicropila populeti]